MTTMKKLIAAACACALAAICLAACSGGSGGKTDPATPSASDVAGWTTVGDALATATDSPSWAYSDEKFVACFQAGDSYFRVVGTIVPGFEDQAGALDFFAEDYNAKFAEVAKMLPLVSAEDITSQLLSEKEIKALVGKTGSELVASGMVFEGYWMYGGNQTGASFAKGCFQYVVTFGVSISESQTEDEGASIMSAKSTEIQMSTFADSAIDPYLA